MSPHDRHPQSKSYPPSTPVAGQAHAWIAWLASGQSDEVKLRAFEQWLAQPGHRRAFEHERVLWRSVGLAAAARPVPSPTSLARRRARSRSRWALAAAAVLALALVMPEAWLRMQADYRSGSAIRTVALPDGSRAVLDADSAIAVRYDRQQRRISLLRGRAWFEVAPDPSKRFLVQAQGGVVEDLSTAFAVDSRNRAVEAAVGQGRVRLASSPGGRWTYLRTGQRAAFAARGQVRRLSDVPADHVAAWRQGELLLDASSVPDALAAIDRYRAGPILMRGDLSALPPINAALRIDRPDQALDALAATAGLRVTRLPMGVAIVQAAGQAPTAR